LLHAIDLASGSSGNVIESNSFDGGCGVTLKVRDASSENTFVGNRFRNQAADALFTDSYCDEDRGVACTKLERECPSWNIRLQGNVYDPPAGAPNGSGSWRWRRPRSAIWGRFGLSRTARSSIR
jgi:hypothetical protein